MKALARLAVRNLVRNRRQTALTVAIVAFGTWTIIVLWGFTEGTTDTMIRAQVSLDTGQLQVHRAGYLDDPNPALAFSSSQAQRVQATLAQRPEVVGAAARLVAEGLLQSAYGSQGVVVRGLDPNAEPRVTQLAQAVVEGHFLEGPGQMLLGSALAKQLDVRLGERVVLQAQGVSRTRSKGFRVVGLLSVGLPLIDEGMAFAALGDVQALTEASGPSEYALALASGASPEAVRDALAAALGADVQISTFFDLNPLVGAIAQIGQVRMIPLMAILAALAGFGVANTMTFTVLQRIREFGVMLALGLRPKQLARLITVESALTGMVGFLIGAALGYALNLYLQREGINMRFYSEAFPDLGMPHTLYSKVAWWHALYGWVVVMLMALVAARAPARRAARLEPTEAMRYV